MSRLGIQILSSVEYEDRNLNFNKNIFVANGNVSVHHTWNYNNIANKSNIYHIPGTILFKDYVRGAWVKVPIDKILNAVSAEHRKVWLRGCGNSSSGFCKSRWERKIH